eukprot:TRINITY_DN5263_c0_g2_i1.p1 TRINITY_DN5263_c0_g2~~TRINITY_DN5263_c0_g2_i1.p1  ORF type:complete len:441 (-),score=133.98 TRINITY_DN5263_c0_g2_i1:297-1619(-)
MMRKLSTSKAKFIPHNDLKEAGQRIRDGGLVAFPTETVYGLGASAYNDKAIRSIFEVKKRPFSDPLVIHVANVDDAVELVELSETATKVYRSLGEKFWPGPLSMVAKAKRSVSDTITATTGFVGIRIPNNELALGLIREANVPIAAPSANRFGHVSPTRAEHVWEDLNSYQIGILDGKDYNSCHVGIESTVLKVHEDGKKITVFRRGAISENCLRKFLKSAGHGDIEIIYIHQANTKSNKPMAEIAPGQMLTHYAPDIDAYIVVDLIRKNLKSGRQQDGEDGEAPLKRQRIEIEGEEELDIEGLFGGETCVSVTNGDPAAILLSGFGVNSSIGAPIDVGSAVVIDFHGQLSDLSTICLKYRDLSRTGNVVEACEKLFEYLRWTETVKGAKHVLLADLSVVENEHAPALFDRMYRASSGRACKVNLHTCADNSNTVMIEKL